MQTLYLFADDLLGDSYQFLIPVYQRAYAWTKKETEQLLHDIEANLDAKADTENLEVCDVHTSHARFARQRSDTIRGCMYLTLPLLQPYNLGLLTLKRCTTKLSDKRHDVVDGQQRLTTLGLIISAVRQRSKDSKIKESLLKRLHQTAEMFPRRESGPRLCVWHDTRAAYEAILYSNDVLQAGADCKILTPHLTSPAALAMAENLATIHAYFDELDERVVEQFASYILLRCEFAVSITNDQTLALQVFRSQTGRGKDLQPSDIFKSELVHALSQEGKTAQRDNFPNFWIEMENTLGRSELQSFVMEAAGLATCTSVADTSNGDDFTTLQLLTEKLRRGYPGGLASFALFFLPEALKAFHVAHCSKTFASPGQAPTPAEADINLALIALNYAFS